GITNEVFASRLDSTSETWSPPVHLTDENPLPADADLPPGHDLVFAPSVALDTDGRFQVVFETMAAPDNNNPRPPPQDQPAGMPTSGAGGTSSVRQLPELAFTHALFFPNREPLPQNAGLPGDGAASGSAVTGEAQITNRGPAGTSVLLEYFDGLPGTNGA